MNINFEGLEQREALVVEVHPGVAFFKDPDIITLRFFRYNDGTLGMDVIGDTLRGSKYTLPAELTSISLEERIDLEFSPLFDGSTRRIKGVVRKITLTSMISTF